MTGEISQGRCLKAALILAGVFLHLLPLLDKGMPIQGLVSCVCFSIKFKKMHNPSD